MQKPEIIRNRISMLRADMKARGISAALMMSTDPHASEYIGDHFKVTEYFSGCTSDNAVLIAEEDSVRLWTDGRYFISAAAELRDTGIQLMKSGEKGVPTVSEYLKKRLRKDDVLAFDGNAVDAKSGKAYRKAAKQAGAVVDSAYDPAKDLWAGRPALPCHPVRVLPPDLAGRSAEEKLSDLREAMKESGASYHFLSKLDDIMWLLNLRGADVECNPVALCFLLVGTQTADLFIQREECTDELISHVRANRIKLHAYEELDAYLTQHHFEGGVSLCVSDVSDAALILIESRAQVIDEISPCTRMKAVKNPTEIAHIRETYLRDSAAVCRFLFRMDRKVGRETVTEYTAAEEMDHLREEIPGFLDLSFPTISAFNADAAMAHYIVEEETAAKVEGNGFLLVDSGGQYLGGTTDVTRTMALGELTDEMKRDFTLVAAAHLRLMNVRFAAGTTGAQLDMIPRALLYAYGLNYNHGTGHGIGYMLNVHEGPQRIGNASGSGSGTPFEAGMLTSDEPGIYREGQYGIRTESILLCVPGGETEFGSFLKFEPLTYAPIDLRAIDTRYLEPSDLQMLNAYHRSVWEKISPLLTDEEREWLRLATREVFAS